jgi:hypothetical protein
LVLRGFTDAEEFCAGFTDAKEAAAEQTSHFTP